MTKMVFKWEMVGIFFIVIAGSLLHFVFDWTGQWKPIGVIAAVNESVWEHFKLAFWPALLYALIEYGYLKGNVNHFVLAKAVGLYAMPLTILALFYIYTWLLGTHNLFLDILIFIIAVIVGQWISYRMMLMDGFPRGLQIIGGAAILVLAAAFAWFTFYPPHIELFKDSPSGQYGIIKHSPLAREGFYNRV